MKSQTKHFLSPLNKLVLYKLEYLYITPTYVAGY